jgi:hypothetical protein
MALALIVLFRVLAPPLGPAPHFSVVSNGTPEEIQKVVDGGYNAFKAYLSKIMKDDSVVLTKRKWVSYFRYILPY